jgi:hypothetical protein
MEGWAGAIKSMPLRHQSLLRWEFAGLDEAILNENWGDSELRECSEE